MAFSSAASTAARCRPALTVLPDVLAIVRLPPDAAIPEWAWGGSLAAVTRTTEELSLVCAQESVPLGVQLSSGWRTLRVEGPLDLTLTGVLAELATTLAQAGIAIFAVSTYDTDYLLLRASSLQRAVQVLVAAGHEVRPLLG